MKKFLVLAVLAAALIAAPATAKEGLYIGAYLPNTEISGNNGTVLESGSGLGFRAGMGFNRYFAIEGNYATTRHDIGGASEDLKALAVGLKINFPLTSLDSANVMTVEPYVLVGYGQYEINSVDGGGTQVGVGIELYLFKELSVNAGWTKTNVSGDIDGDVKTFDIGLMYHFI